MFQNKLTTLIQISICVFLSACASNEAANSNSTDSTQLQNPSNQESIIGLWEYVSENGEQQTYEFVSSEEYIEDFAYYGKYELLSEETIALYWNQDTKILRLVGVSKDTLVLEENGKQITFQKIPAATNLNQDIIGVWEWSDGTVTEFAQNGIFLTNAWFYENEYYKVISNNTVAIFEGEQLERRKYLFTFMKGENDGLVALFPKGIISLNSESDEPPSTLIKLKGYPNLNNDIIGTWKNEDGEISLEFVNSGKMIAHQENAIYSYEVISDNSIMVLDTNSNPGFLNILSISPNELQIRIWESGPNFSSVKHQFTKAK